MHGLRAAASALFCALGLLHSTAVHAAWTHDPSRNLAVCRAIGDQRNVAMAPDGQGGAFIAWEDYRTPANGGDIYAQHVLKSGTVDPTWPVNGLAVVALPGPQLVPVAVSDGTGGVIIAWEDQRGSNYDIYAQRISSIGAVVSPWPANGKQLSSSTSNDLTPRIASDATGGAWVAWTRDYTTSTPGDYDPIVSHVLANSNLQLGLGYDIDLASTNQSNPTLAPDDSGGCFVAYQTNAPGNFDIRTLRMRVDGTFAWNVFVCQAGLDQTAPIISDDGNGGAYVAWTDARAGTGYSDVFGNRVHANGTFALLWNQGGGGAGIAFGGLPNSVTINSLVPDGEGGMIFCYNVVGFDWQSYAVRFDPVDVLWPGWPYGYGLPYLGGLSGVVISDGHGGALCAGSSPPHVAAAYVTEGGNTAPGWSQFSTISVV